MSRALILMFSAIVLVPSLSFATDADKDLELHRVKAQKFIEAKDWPSAETESKVIVDKAPQDMDGWLMYGIIEQRLEHNEAAIKAYHKYLDLNPPENKAQAVRTKLADLEVRSAKQNQEVKAVDEEKYGPRSSGVFFGYAPVYNPSTSYVLGGNVKDNYQFGVQFDRFLIGLQYDTGTIPHFQAPTTTGSTTTYSTVGPATLKTYVFYFEGNFPMTEPFRGKTGPFSFYIPLHFGTFQNTIKLNSGDRSFSNFGFELASGVGVEWYSRSPFKFGLTALYHQGWGITPLADSSGTQDKAVKNTAGTEAGGGNVGFEVKLTLSFLFGHEKTVAEKAGAG